LSDASAAEGIQRGKSSFSSLFSSSFRSPFVAENEARFLKRRRGCKSVLQECRSASTASNRIERRTRSLETKKKVRNDQRWCSLRSNEACGVSAVCLRLYRRNDGGGGGDGVKKGEKAKRKNGVGTERAGNEEQVGLKLSTLADDGTRLVGERCESR
jgi:hypothetical protein